MVRSNKVPKIISLLEREYGTENFVYYDNPLDQLILTILSQNTNWQNCRRSFANLKQRFKSWEQVMVSNVNQIATTIKSGGLGKIKAKRIHSFLKTLWKMKGSLDLSFLCDIDSGEGLAFLNSFKGIGPKTAACVLLFSCEAPRLYSRGFSCYGVPWSGTPHRPPFLLSPLEITHPEISKKFRVLSPGNSLNSTGNAISGTQSWKFFEFRRARKQEGLVRG